MQRYTMLREASLQRSQAMADYVRQSEECRSRYLLRYFGQEEADDCGTCDVCLRRRSETRKLLREWFAAHPGWTEDDLKAFCADPASGLSPDAAEIAREILDNGE